MLEISGAFAERQLGAFARPRRSSPARRFVLGGTFFPLDGRRTLRDRGRLNPSLRNDFRRAVRLRWRMRRGALGLCDKRYTTLDLRIRSDPIPTEPNFLSQHPLQMPLILRSIATSAGSRLFSDEVTAGAVVADTGAVLFGAR
jgi:hypothetical protein